MHVAAVHAAAMLLMLLILWNIATYTIVLFDSVIQLYKLSGNVLVATLQVMPINY